MKLVKISNWIPKGNQEDFNKNINTDLKNVMLFSEGRVRFGNAVDGARGENISGEFHIFTSVKTNTAETVISHTLGSIPTGYLVINQNNSGSLYTSGTGWTISNIYIRSTTTNTQYTIFILK
jgi:hypothetical protein